MGSVSYKWYIIVFEHQLFRNNRVISPMSRVFANVLRDRDSIPGWVIPKTQMLLDAALLTSQHYKVEIKVKVERSWEWSSALSYTSV